jgi:DNA-binding NtrC family response regulator
MERTSSTILLVDDDPDLIGALRNRFRTAEKGRWHILTASNGKEALEVVSRSGVDVVVTDILMPDKDGLELVMELHKAHPAVKIIAMSGGGPRIGTEPLKFARQLGAHMTIEKPFEFARLVEMLEALTGGRGSSPRAGVEG